MRRPRPGFTLIESCAAAVLLTAALAFAVALLTAVGRQRHSASLHAKAVIAADNLLGRLTAEPFAALTPERAEEMGRASPIDEELPDGAVAVEVAAVEGSPPGKRIQVELTWQPRASGPPSRHAVAAWVFEEGK